MGVAAVLTASVMAAAYVRVSVFRNAVEPLFSVGVSGSFFRHDFAWGYTLLLLVWPIVVVTGRPGRWAVARAIFCGVCLVAAVGAQTALANPFAPAQELKNGANLVAVLTLCVVYAGTSVLVGKAPRRRMLDIPETSETSYANPPDQ